MISKGPSGHVPTDPRCGEAAHASLQCVANLTAKIAAGLSVRYFSLYFWKELHMRPAYVMLLLVAAQVGGSAATTGTTGGAGAWSAEIGDQTPCPRGCSPPHLP